MDEYTKIDLNDCIYDAEQAGERMMGTRKWVWAAISRVRNKDGYEQRTLDIYAYGKTGAINSYLQKIVDYAHSLQDEDFRVEITIRNKPRINDGIVDANFSEELVKTKE